ncbi:hypothetical protein GA0115246_105921, partial [Streptomyces sp. SolWspMP-sol7th]
MHGGQLAVQAGRLGVLGAHEAVGEGPAVPVGGPRPVAEFLVGTREGLHRAARRVRVAPGAGRVERGAVAGERLSGAARAGVEVGE